MNVAGNHHILKSQKLLALIPFRASVVGVVSAVVWFTEQKHVCMPQSQLLSYREQGKYKILNAMDNVSFSHVKITADEKLLILLQIWNTAHDSTPGVNLQIFCNFEIKTWWSQRWQWNDWNENIQFYNHTQTNCRCCQSNDSETFVRRYIWMYGSCGGCADICCWMRF